MKNLYKNLFLFFTGMSLAYGMHQDFGDKDSFAHTANNPTGKNTVYYVLDIGELGRLPLELINIIVINFLKSKNNNILTDYAVCKCFDKFIAKNVDFPAFEKWINDIDLKIPFARFIWPYMEKLSICEGNITDRSLKLISQCSSLTSLSLSYCPYITLGLPLLGFLTNLTKLSLAGLTGSVTESGIAHLSNFTNLVCLDLSDIRGITNDCFSNFANLNKLTSLNLAFSSVGNEGVRHLSNLTNLTDLGIFNCTQITEACLPYLSKCTKLKDFRFGTDQL